jgi:hypothetical protein
MATSPIATPVTERTAQVGELHYAIKLTAPTVTPGGLVRVALRIGDGASHVVTLDACQLVAITVTAPGRAARPVPSSPCAGGGVRIRGEHSFTFGAQTLAPATPGHYVVSVARATVLPASLLPPLDLQVTQPRIPTAPSSCVDADLKLRGPVGMPAPQVVTAPITFNLGDVAAAVTILPPTNPRAATVTAEQAWKYFDRGGGWIPISPLGTYQLLLGDVTVLQGPPNQLAWVLVARHAPQAKGIGLAQPVGVTGPSGPTARDCLFADGISGVNAIGNPSGLGIETGRFQP